MIGNDRIFMSMRYKIFEGVFICLCFAMGSKCGDMGILMK